MTQEQIVRELRNHRYGRLPTLASIARAAGLSRPTVYEVIKTGQVSDRVGEALARALRGDRIAASHNPRSPR